MSTSQRAVMLCIWGVKAGMACLQVKLGVLPYLSALLFKGALQMSRFTLLYLGLGPEGTQHPHFLAHVYYGQTAGWIKMPLGTEVGLGPGDIVTWGPISSPKRGTAALPNFRPMSIVAKWSPISATAEFLFCFAAISFFTARAMLALQALY